MYGLGLCAEQFWAMTPRELAAYSAVAERHRELQMGLYAGLQATLHNAHFTRPDKKPFTPAMFLGSEKTKAEKEPQWKRDLAESRRALHIVKTDQGKPETKQMMERFDDRTRRAQEAKKRGEPREVIERIMTGVA